MGAPIAVTPLVTAVETRANTISNVEVYESKVPDTVPTISADDLRVRPYIVHYPAAGQPGIEEDLEGRDIDLAWTFQLTCVAGRRDDALALIDAVTAKFQMWWPDLEGLTFSRCRQLNDPGPIRRDDAEFPPRYWLPLVYGLPVGY